LAISPYIAKAMEGKSNCETVYIAGEPYIMTTRIIGDDELLLWLGRGQDEIWDKDKRTDTRDLAGSHQTLAETASFDSIGNGVDYLPFPKNVTGQAETRLSKIQQKFVPRVRFLLLEGIFTPHLNLIDSHDNEVPPRRATAPARVLSIDLYSEKEGILRFTVQDGTNILELGIHPRDICFPPLAQGGAFPGSGPYMAYMFLPFWDLLVQLFTLPELYVVPTHLVEQFRFSTLSAFADLIMHPTNCGLITKTAAVYWAFQTPLNLRFPAVVPRHAPLLNLGTSCFAGSVLQLLAGVPQLPSRFAEISTGLFKLWMEIIVALREGLTHKANHLFERAYHTLPAVLGMGQQDPAEFLDYLIKIGEDWLPEPFQAFKAELQVVEQCHAHNRGIPCDYLVVRKDVCYAANLPISVPIETEHVARTLESLLSNYSTIGNVMERVCPKCRSFSSIRQYHKIVKIPDVLICQLGRTEIKHRAGRPSETFRRTLPVIVDARVEVPLSSNVLGAPILRHSEYREIGQIHHCTTQANLHTDAEDPRSYLSTTAGHAVSYLRTSPTTYTYCNDDSIRNVSEAFVRQHSRKVTLIALTAVPPAEDFLALSERYCFLASPSCQ
jgi:hypothetical protein